MMNQKTVDNTSTETKKRKSISYAKWGYIFLIPFFVVYLLFTLYPQLLTVFYSFTETRKVGLTSIGPNWVGFDNYVAIFQPNSKGNIQILLGLRNTVIMWLLGVIPQMVVALLLALLFTSTRLNLKGTGFFKSVFYFPNLIMASAFSMLFFMVFQDNGPINQILGRSTVDGTSILFMSIPWSARSLVALMNFLMWFGNTTIVLMAGIQGIDESLFESARLDGANSRRVLFDITLPLLKPIVIYVVITSMLGGLQMFDVPQLLTSGKGDAIDYTRTMVMVLNDYMRVENYGMAGAVSVILFLITGVFSIIVFKSMVKNDN